MSGNPSSPKGIRDDRITAARKWLDRADEQFASGQDIMAAATLMLAQAELKLLVEAASEAPREIEPIAGHSPIRKNKAVFTHRAFTFAAMAACLLVGLVLGQYISGPSAPGPGTDTAPAIQLADRSGSPDITPPDVVSVDVPVSAGQSEAVLASEPEPAPVEDNQPTPSSVPVYRPRPRQPRPEPDPVDIVTVTEVPDAETPGPVNTATGNSNTPVSPDTGVVDIPSGNEISPAEVALMTIQALSERLFNDNSPASEM